MNKIGTINIIKAYLGTKELTATNAYVGEFPLIEGGTPPAPPILIPDDEIWYTTANSAVLSIYDSQQSLPSVVSNGYVGDKGIVKFASAVTTIGEECFMYTNGISIIIPNSVTTIGMAAFTDSTDLTSITIGSGVTSIDSYAIGAPTLSNLSFNGTKAQWNAVTKAQNWIVGDVSVVHCLDGDVPL